MQITSNATPYVADVFPSLDKSGRKHCNVLVKATFDVSPDGVCVAAERQIAPVYSDEHFGDPGNTAIRSESDFVPVKPRADVLLEANATSRGGRPVASIEVTLRCASYEKRAQVFGERTWQAGHWGVRASDPTPFTTMPLAWHRAFGGADPKPPQGAKVPVELRNLVGVGFRVQRDFLLDGQPLPNIERPDALIRTWSDKPEPIGFGPVGRACQPRLRFAGTYDRAWVENVRPFLPADFDDRYYQAAPMDQQIARLEPGMEFACSNMNETGSFVVRLPTFAVPITFMFSNESSKHEITADTLILKPCANQIVLVGRVGIPMPRKLTTLREICVGRVAKTLTPPSAKLHFDNLGDAVLSLHRRG